jgi:hypothetical protein
MNLLFVYDRLGVKGQTKGASRNPDLIRVASICGAEKWEANLNSTCVTCQLSIFIATLHFVLRSQYTVHLCLAYIIISKGLVLRWGYIPEEKGANPTKNSHSQQCNS